MSEPLYRVIYNDLLSQIKSGALAPGSRLPTEHALMERYRVGRVTAGRALNLLREDGLIIRSTKIGSVVCIGSEHGAARRRTIPFLTIHCDDSIPGLLAAAEAEAALHGYSLALYETKKSAETERDILAGILKTGAPGVISYPLNGEFTNLSAYVELMRAGIPVVTVDKRIWMPNAYIPCITTDNRKAFRRLTEWVIDQGHRRIGYCCADFSQANARYRHQGYAEALIAHGIPYDDALVDQLLVRITPYRSDAAVSLPFLRYLLELPEPPTALVCECDALAFRMMREAKKLGIRLPEQLSITGFDNIGMCELCHVPLTTMEQDFTAIGREAVRQLLAMMQDKPVPPLTLFDAKLVKRESVLRMDPTNHAT